MKLENQVCSLELSKKLKELGAEQDGYYIWYKHKDLEQQFQINPKGYQIHPKQGDNKFIEWYSAFTVAELGEMLPNDKIRIFKMNDRFFVESYEIDNLEFSNAGERFVDKSEANARAKMLIYLIENKLI